MTNRNHAPNVCRACSSRKKACDKALPACSFCKKRGVPCQYLSTAKTRRVHNPGRHFVPVQTEEFTAAARSGQQEPFLLTSLLSSEHLLDESVDREVNHVLHFLGRSHDNVISGYFEIYNQWLPMATREVFDGRWSKHRRTGEIPRADLSILLLAMCLITTIPALEINPTQSAFDKRSFYSLTKLMLSRVQFVVHTSLPLVQALLIIALCEYACARPEAAHVSMATCKGLIQTLRREHLGQNEIEADEEITRLKISAAILERLVWSEIDARNLGLLTYDPGPDIRSLKDQDERQALGELQMQVRIVELLDQVLRGASHPVDPVHGASPILRGLMDLDEDIRDYMHSIMDSEVQDNTYRTTVSNCVALSVRCLFVLHKTIARLFSTLREQKDCHVKKFAMAALDMVSNMVVETARRDAPVVAVLPLCCYYNLRDAREYLQEQHRLTGQDEPSGDVECLLRSEESYRKRWVF